MDPIMRLGVIFELWRKLLNGGLGANKMPRAHSQKIGVNDFKSVH